MGSSGICSRAGRRFADCRQALGQSFSGGLGTQSPQGLTSLPAEPGASGLHLFQTHLILAENIPLQNAEPCVLAVEVMKHIYVK